MFALVLAALLWDGPEARLSAVEVAGATLAEPFGVGHAADGSLWVVEMAGNRVRRVEKSGRVSTVVEGLKGPHSIAVGPGGLLYIADTNNHRVLKYDPASGTTTPFAGTGAKGFAGDGGPGIAATLNGPKHLAIDRDGGVLIADTENHAIRKFLPADGTITRVAGTGVRGLGRAAGSPKGVALDRPHGVSVAADGTLYIADSDNGRILRVDR